MPRAGAPARREGNESARDPLPAPVRAAGAPGPRRKGGGKISGAAGKRRAQGMARHASSPVPQHVLAALLSSLLALTLPACATHVSLDTPETRSIPVIPITPVPAPQPAPEPPVEVYKVEPPGDTGAPADGTPAAPGATPVQPQDEERLRTWVNDQNRLYTVAAPLMIRNVDLCSRNARRILGLTAKNKYSYSSDLVPAAMSALGLDDRLRVTQVLPGSGAGTAGIAEGDIIIAVNGKPAPEGENAEREAAVLFASESRGQSSIQLTVLRKDQETSLDVPLTQACAFGVELGDLDSIASLADGYRVLVSRGMLGFVQSDTELAYVIAHEFGHNLITTHARAGMSAAIDRYRNIARPPLDDDGQIQLPPYSKADEVRADEIALYMLARAGFAIENYASFWSRLDAAPSVMRVHAPAEERFAAIASVIRAIGRKKARGEPLLPSP